MKALNLDRAIQITQTGAVFTGSIADLKNLKSEFSRRNYIRLRSLFPSELLEELHHSVENSKWSERSHKKIGVEICVTDPAIVGVINFLFNDQTLFEILQEITGCGSIRSFGGRIYRMIPDAGHYDSWHTDLGRHRLLALSINLGKEPYEGGILQIRENGSPEPPTNVSNTGFGDAIVFRLAPHLAHRVTKVEGTVPKTAFAGWFQSEPDYWASIAAKLQENER